MNIDTVMVTWSSILPVMFEIRLLALIIGIALLSHAFCMAGFVPENTPWTLASIIGLMAGSGIGLILGAFSGNLSLLLISALATSASLTMMALWLWHKGMHVSKFIIQLNQ